MDALVPMFILVILFFFICYLIMDVEETENGVNKTAVIAVLFIAISFGAGYFQASKKPDDPKLTSDTKLVIKWIK
jgi:hypothetical protein